MRRQSKTGAEAKWMRILSETQRHVNELSHRARGKKKQESPQEVAVNLQGNAIVRNGVAKFTDVSFDVPGGFDLQENILRVSSCGDACGLLASVAHVAKDIPPRITFAYVGHDLGGSRVSQVARRAPAAARVP